MTDRGNIFICPDVEHLQQFVTEQFHAMDSQDGTVDGRIDPDKVIAAAGSDSVTGKFLQPFLSQDGTPSALLTVPDDATIKSALAQLVQNLPSLNTTAGPVKCEDQDQLGQQLVGVMQSLLRQPAR